MNLLDAIFTCHVCGRARLSRHVAIARHSHTDAAGVTVQDNVRYCVDNAECFRMARVHNLTSLALKRTNDDLRELGIAHRTLRASFKARLMGVAVVAALFGWLLHGSL